MIAFFTRLPQIFKKAFSLLRRSDPLILASSTAFFATFSLAPILVILINVLSFIYFKSELVSNQLFGRIGELFGAETARQVRDIVNNFSAIKGQWWITIGGSVFLLFVATTLLRIIKHALHQLWHIRRKPANRLRYNLRERLTSVGMILFIGFLFVITLLLDTSATVLRDYLQDLTPSINGILIHVFHTLFSIVIIAAWFTLLYRILPDAHVSWNVAIPGGLLTGVLFSIGEFILGKLLVYGSIETIFGASASIALILLFIFYSSMIMYFGASFTYAYGETVSRPIRPKSVAERYEKRAVTRSSDH